MSRREWTLLRKAKGRVVTRPELQKLDDLLSKLDKAQAGYAIRQYGLKTEDPHLGDLAEWLTDNQMPEEIVCAAYLTKLPEIVKLGSDLETLQAAWFPTKETKAQIEALDAKLRRALS